MAIKQVKVMINGTWTILNYNSYNGKYEANIAAPSQTSFNVNAGHYYPVTVEAVSNSGVTTVKDDTDTTLGSYLKLKVKEISRPNIVINSPSDNAFVRNSSQPVSFTLSDEQGGSGIDIKSLRLTIDQQASLTNTSGGMEISNVNGSYKVTYTPVNALSDGPHTYKINVSDNDGNTAVERTLQYTVDTIPPMLDVSSPQDNETYTAQSIFTINGTTSDENGVSIQILLNNVDQGIISLSGNSFAKSVSLVNGVNTIKVIASDMAGQSTEISRVVTFDASPPVISEISITPNPINVGNSFIVSIKAT